MSRLVVSLSVSALVWMVGGGALDPAGGESGRFKTVARGIEHMAFQSQDPSAGPFSGHAFRIDLGAVTLRLVPAGGPASRRTVEQIAADYPAIVAVNASFFDADGRAMGLAVDEGKVLAASKRPSWGALVVDGTAAQILLASRISSPSARLIVQGIPRLVIGGQIPPLKAQIAERTAVCAAGRTVVLVVSTQAEATVFARFLSAPVESGGLGCSDALNLDGGPSTQLVAKLPSLTVSVPGGWGVPNALIAVPGT